MYRPVLVKNARGEIVIVGTMENPSSSLSD